jgi:catechol 2,3-dioxygenase-like lactoylglutathione lyase family enzyme
VAFSKNGIAQMSIRRIVPDVQSKHLDASRQFYVDVLGLEVAMDMGSIVTLVSPSNSTAQVTLMSDDSSAILPQISVEVSDVDDVHSRALSRGLKILYPLTNEPWGVRRFFVADPSGTIINVMCHISGVPSEETIEPPQNFNSSRDIPRSR